MTPALCLGAWVEGGKWGWLPSSNQSSPCALWSQPHFVSSTSETLEPLFSQATGKKKQKKQKKHIYITEKNQGTFQRLTVGIIPPGEGMPVQVGDSPDTDQG